MRREAEGLVLVKRGEESDSIFPVIPHSAEADSSWLLSPLHTHLSLLQAEHTQLLQHLLVHHVVLLISQLTASVLLVRAASTAVCECHHRAKSWGLGDEGKRNK